MSAKWQYDEIEVRLASPARPQTSPAPHSTEDRKASLVAVLPADVDRLRHLIPLSDATSAAGWPYQDRYTVTVRSPAGDQTSGEFHFPFSAAKVLELLERGPWLADEIIERRGRQVPKDELAQLLAGIDCLQLVVTNTCCTASTLPPSLVQAAVRSAIGMRYLIVDEVAVRFTYLFYKSLLKCRRQIDAALAETRKWLLLETNQRFPGQWAYPSLCTSVDGDDFFLLNDNLRSMFQTDSAPA
jgi:hypothetical protein